jgi:hypothetical protein
MPFTQYPDVLSPNYNYDESFTYESTSNESTVFDTILSTTQSFTPIPNPIPTDFSQYINNLPIIENSTTIVNPTSTATTLPSPFILPEESSTVYLVLHNNYPIYCIKRGSQFYFLQKHLGQAFYKNLSTFNSVCWIHKVEKIHASSTELRLIKNSHPSQEQGLKKATMISLPALKLLCDTIKKPEIYNIMYKLIENLVCYNYT